MHTSRTTAAANPDDELAALVRTLHETQQRLQELGGGEVDAVVLPTGHSYLMREAQERLHQSETIQRQLATTQTAILNALPAHIALLDGYGVILSVNETWRHFATANALLSPDFGVGQNYLAICEQAQGDCAEEAHQAATGIRAVLSGAVQEFVLEYPCHSPTEERWFRLMVNPVMADRPAGAAVMHIDITERRQAENDLRESNEKFRQLADNITDAFWIRSPDMREVHYVSPAFERIWGRSVESLYAHPEKWADFILPEDRERALGAFAALTGNAPLLDIEYRIVRPGGEVRWVRVRGFQVRDAAGQLIRHAGIVTDITERKRADEALRESEGRFSGAFEHAPIGMALVAPDGRWLKVNQALCNLVGYSEAELLTRTFQDITHPEDLAADLECVRQILAGETRSYQMEKRYVHARGHFVSVLLNVSLVRDDQGQPRYFISQIQDITERKQAEETTRLLAERLTTTLESLTDGFYTVDRDWRFTYVNHEAERMLRRARADLLGAIVWDQFPEARGTAFQISLERARVENVVVEFEEFYPPLDTWFEMHIYPSAQGLAVYFRDVTEQRQARETLRVSEERFRVLAKATNDAIWDWDLGTNTLWWNDGFEALFGFRRDEIEPTIEGWTSRIHPADRTHIVDDIHRSIEAGSEHWSGEYRFARKDGTYAYVLDRGHVLRDPTGKPLRMIGGMTDLTERKAAADRVAEQAALLNAASDAIMLIDLADRIVLWNRSAEQIYGWTAAEAVGKKSRELFGAETAKFDAAVHALLAKDLWRGELLKHAKDGRILMMDVRWTLVRDEAGQPKSILAINTDITERKKLEAQFLRVQRMESIGTLAGGIAHDLNNILAPIMMSVSLLQREITSEMGREMLGTLQVCSQRGADLVRQVLSFARGIEGQRIVVNPIHLVREIQKIIRETFPKNIAFKFSLPRDHGMVTGDPTQLHQVFMNLCVNARDAMPKGGALTVTMENILVDDVYAGMNPDAKPGAHVMIKVSDTGSGIPPDIRERIFEPFFTTKEVGKGTGLGLSTTLAIVRSHGGFIQVYSEPGQGTQFKVYLPANTTAAADERVAVERAELPRGQGELVLVVDDEESIRNIAQKTLSHYGYRVVLAANGAEAVALYATQRDTIAVVLTDMAMPVMDGPATIIALKTLDPRAKIIGSSGIAVEGSVAKAVGAGVQHFIPKPYTAEKLLTVLAQILREPV